MINHDETLHRFSCTEAGHECVLEYEMKSANTMDIYRTLVHNDLRGKGLAEQLMKSASEYARDRGLSIFPSCPYAVSFFKRHPEYALVLEADVDLENGGSCRIS
jgi:uncharacterized protein